jgi:hypothetical protein
VVPKDVPRNATVLAGARADRSSFGCNIDGSRTVYGEEYLATIKKLIPRINHLEDWESVHREVARLVDEREGKLGVYADQRSTPLIVSGAMDSELD